MATVWNMLHCIKHLCTLEVDTGLASEVARVLEDSSVTENSSTLSDCKQSSYTFCIDSY